MKISIRECLHSYAAGLQKDWSHDRLSTVGASEVGQCMRKTWFAKNETPADPDYQDRYGARLRGDVIESAYWVPGLRSSLPDGVKLLYAGEEQQTIVDGYLSATTDGLLVGVARDCLAHMGIPDIGADCINLDCKSIDPRVDLRVEKPEHSFQVQAQVGLMRFKGEYRPEYSLLTYTDASFWDDISEFAVKFDPKIYDAAKARARQIMTADDPLRLRPEGKLSGGDECRYCPYASHCAGVSVAGIPIDDPRPLGDNTIAEFGLLRERERALAAQAEDIAAQHAAAKEDIKESLRTHGVRKVRGKGWSISWTPVKGRETVDLKAAEQAGIDLSPFKKIGNPADRLAVT